MTKILDLNLQSGFEPKYNNGLKKIKNDFFKKVFHNFCNRETIPS